jgi:hypothetical protein
MKGNVNPTTKLASQFNIPEKLIAGGLGPCLNSSPPRNKGMGPRKEIKIFLQQVIANTEKNKIYSSLIFLKVSTFLS